MEQHPSEPGYSIQWAYGVVSTFTNKYARATTIVQKYYGFNDSNVAGWLANRQERWKNYKKIVKRVDKMEKDRRRRMPGWTISVNACVVLATKSVLDGF